MSQNRSKVLLSLLGGLAVIYCVAAEVFVVTNPDLRLRALLADASDQGPGVILQATPSQEDCLGADPTITLTQPDPRTLSPCIVKSGLFNAPDCSLTHSANQP